MDYMPEDQHVLVIGSAGVDIKGRPDRALQPGGPVPGVIRSSVGGVARNIAENLARLEVPTTLLSAVGDDEPGARVLSCCADAGVNIEHIQVLPRERTGHYIAMLTPDGELDLSISDYDISRHISASYLQQQKALFATAELVVIDASLDDSTLRAIFRLAKQYDLPVCADPTSPSLAGRLAHYLPDIYLTTPNMAEAAALCNQDSVPPKDRESGLEMAACLLDTGVKVATITLGINGLVYVSGSDRGHIPAPETEVVDETGAGDALTAAVIFGLLNEVPLDEAMRLGVTAAALTLSSRETVLPELSQELLYDQLVV